MPTLGELKERLDLRRLVARTHTLARSGKVHCPFHDDRHPSCHIYADGYKCFACGAYGDHVDWLVRVEGLSTSQAVRTLQNLGGSTLSGPPEHAQRSSALTSPLEADFPPLESGELRDYAFHLTRTGEVPAALRGRGLELSDVRRLGLAAVGEDALLPIYGPQGRIVALKRRSASAPGGLRYSYVKAGRGSPAWASPGVWHDKLLLIEGELNAMVSYLALDALEAPFSVLGMAGVYGSLYPELVRVETVYLLADKDAAGRRALTRWRQLLERLGARRVRCLPLMSEDACELAGRMGKAYLAAFLLTLIAAAERGCSTECGSGLWSVTA